MFGIDDLFGLGASILGGAIGGGEGGSDRDKALKLIKESVDELKAIGIPDMEAQKLVLEKYRNEGKLTPELEQVITQGDSELGNISTDPRLKEAQLNALTSLQDIGEGGGFNLTDKANLEKTMGEIGASEKGRRDAILADTRARGQMGSGLELAAQLQNEQASAERAHQAGLQNAAEGRARALQAIQSAGAMGGTMRSQEFAEQEAKAKAQDAINAFNAKNRQAVQGANVNRSNDANQYNLTSAQRISDANVDTANKEQTANKGLYQTQFNNEMTKAGALSNARSGNAQALNQNADRTGAMWTGLGQGVGQGVQAIKTANQNQAARDKSDQRWDDFMKMFGG